MKASLLFLLFLISCSLPKAKGPYTYQAPPEGMATIYIYRLDTSIDAANIDIPVFYVNDDKQGKLLIGGHYVAMVNAGKAEVAYKNSLFGIRFPWKATKLSFNAEANKVYYVRFSIEGLMRIMQFKMIPNSQAQQEIVTTKEMH